MDVETLLAVVGGIGGAVSVIVTSLRKRQDISIEEMQSRISSQGKRIAALERDNKALHIENSNIKDQAHRENQALQVESLKQQRTIFDLKMALASAGIPDPSEKKS